MPAPADLQPTGLSKLLGITFTFAARHRVVAQLDIEPDHLTDQGAVSNAVITALADCASQHGARLALPTGQTSRTIETRTTLLASGRGNTLRAEASPTHAEPALSVWRSLVFRDEEQVAEVTQIQLTTTAETPPATDRTPEPRHPDPVQGPPGEGYSRAVADERWRRIVEGASKVIAAKGFAKATIREIAAAAEMPVATMYQYLERKEDILYNVYRFFMTDIVASLTRWRTGDLPPDERLAGAIRTTIDVFDANHRFIKLMFQETRSLTAEARQQVYALDAEYIAVFRDLLAEAMRNGHVRVRNLELAANFIYFLCTIWPLRFWSIGKFGEAAVKEDIVDFVLHGLAADAHAAARPVARKPAKPCATAAQREAT